MADFFDVVIKDVELYGAGADTSEPVSAVNANRRVATANANNDSLVDSLTVWSRTHTDVQHPTIYRYLTIHLLPYLNIHFFPY